MSRRTPLSITHPDYEKMWSDRNTTKFNEITYGSHKKVWWKCSEGHEWEQSPHVYFQCKYDCAFCTGYAVLREDTVAIKQPEFLKIVHPDDRHFLYECVSGSHKKIRWVCKNGHERKKSIRAVVQMNYGCPYCSRKRFHKDNSLGSLRPDLIGEFDNEKNGCSLFDILIGYKKNVWWKCKLGHEYFSSPWNTADRKIPCFYCSNEKVSKHYNLSITHPDISKEWHPDNIKSPCQYTPGSGARVKWLCSKNHVFYSTIGNRTNKNGGTGCPLCSQSSGEQKISDFLEEHNINFVTQKTYDGCVHINKLRFDFFIRSKNLIVEYDGLQHFNLRKFRDSENVILRFKRDMIKTNFCGENNITILRIPYTDSNKIYNILENLDNYKSGSLYTNFSDNEIVELVYKIHDAVYDGEYTIEEGVNEILKIIQ